MNRTKISVVKGSDLRANDIMTVVGVISADTLVKRHNVPARHHLKKTGYQRVASTVRVNRLASELNKKKVDLPTAVLLNIRDVTSDDVISSDPNSNQLILDLGEDDKNNSLVLYIVDGQHRIKALEKAMEDGVTGLRNFKIPFVCMIGATEEQEMEQFHVVNSNAKSVPTDLALELLKERSKNSEFMKDLIEKGKKWQIEAQTAAELLAKSSSIWKDKIRFANMPKGDTTIPSASMAKSLEPLFRHTPTFIAIKDPQKQMQIIDAYWKGIRKILEDAIDKPREYSIQKGIGVKALHGIFPIVIEHVRSKGGSIYSDVAYQEILEDPLNNIEGNNGHHDHVAGIDFWKTGKDGVIGKYSSGSGINALIEDLKSLLPEIEAE
ncbi:DGQHR domain-containing protein [Candidatus Spongiihabitans sp.]|uniref:DGQHR domain-containing protein n=1 Tax=Candidatus Spongiihabitans sp. TaxID=3101308 RepID=UPI003C7C3F15